MSKRRRQEILSGLYGFYLNFGPRHYVDANTLSGFKPGEEDFHYSLNQLIEEALILCVEGKDKHPAVAINPAKVKDIRVEINVWYRDARFLISTTLGIAGWVVAFIGLLNN